MRVAKRNRFIGMVVTAFMLAFAYILQTGVVAQAATTSNGFKYELNGNEATITGYTGSAVKIVIPSTIKAGGISYKVTQLGEYAFSSNTKIRSVVIGNSVTIIGQGSFDGCTNLQSAVIGNSVTEIGWEAFRECSSLQNVTIGNAVTKIGKSAFSGCSKLSTIVLPIGVKEIGEYAFVNVGMDDSVKVVKIYIPSTVNNMYFEMSKEQPSSTKWELSGIYGDVGINGDTTRSTGLEKTIYYIVKGSYGEKYFKYVKSRAGVIPSRYNISSLVNATHSLINYTYWDESVLIKSIKKIKGTQYLVDRSGNVVNATGVYKVGSTFVNASKGALVKGDSFGKYGNVYAYFKDGKFAKKTTIVKYGSKQFYVKNGVWASTYSGTVTVNGKKYKVVKGVVK